MRAVEQVKVCRFLSTVVAPVAGAVVAVHVGTSPVTLSGDATPGTLEGVLLVVVSVPVIHPIIEEAAAVGALLARGAGMCRAVAVVAPGLAAGFTGYLVESAGIFCGGACLLHSTIGLRTDSLDVGAVGTGAFGCGLGGIDFEQLESVLLALCRELVNHLSRQLLFAICAGTRNGVLA